jgi:hypothetical protein
LDTLSPHPFRPVLRKLCAVEPVACPFVYQHRTVYFQPAGIRTADIPTIHHNKEARRYSRLSAAKINVRHGTTGTNAYCHKQIGGPPKLQDALTPTTTRKKLRADYTATIQFRMFCLSQSIF